MISNAVELKLIYILGITNIISILLVLFTCRCVPAWKLTRRLMAYKWYQRFFKYHYYLWLILGISVIAHMVFAISLMGFPL